jgi:hypothetical protein
MPAAGEAQSPNIVKWSTFFFLIALWVIFAVDFIIRTSHVSIDGVRYFVIFDDVMIGMRYAKNLVQHHALVWNLGDRVEGFSNPLWVFIMAATIWLFGTHFAPLVMQILGGLICVALFAYFFRCAKRTRAGFAAAIAGTAFLVLSYPISYWGLGGMEASAMCLIYALSVGAQYQYENGERKNPLILHAVLIAIAYSLHPDGWLALVPFFAACWYDSVKAKDYRPAVVAVILPSAVALGTVLARFAYYGEWVPNTYVLKVEGYSLALRLKNGIAYLTPFFQENLGALALIGLSAISRKKIAYLNILAVDILLMYQAYVGGDPWLYWRFILPVYVATAFAIVILFDYLSGLHQEQGSEAAKANPRGTALAVLLLPLPCALFEAYVFFQHRGIDAVDRRPLLVAYFIAAAAMVVVLAKATTSSAPNPRPVLFTLAKSAIIVVAAYSALLCDLPFKLDFGHHKPYVFDGEAHMIDKAVLANRLFGPGKTHVVVWAGTYGYYVDGTMIDALGTCDKPTARYPVNLGVSWDGMMGVPGHAKFDFRDSILKRKPDIVVERASWGPQDVSPEMKDDYVLLKSQGVSLCVRKPLGAGLEPLLQGSCPSNFFYTARK